MKSTLLAAVLLAAAASSPAFAQGGTNSATSSQSAANSGQNTVVQKIQDDLKKAGFTDIKIVAESFVVQAKTKDGKTPTVAPDGDVYAFVLPSINEGDAPSIEGGGEFVAAFSNEPAVQKVQEYMTTPDFANARVKLGGVISANSGADPTLASSQFLQEAMKLVQDKNTVFRFDASDLMPATVGSGSFWKGMVSWIDGMPTKDVLTAIQAGYQN